MNLKELKIEVSAITKALRNEFGLFQLNYFKKQRKDLFNVIDIIAVHPGQAGVLGVQVTSRVHTQERVHKCKKEPMIKTWLTAQNKLEVHGWGLMGKVGKRKKYEVKIVEIK